ncbi:hypothetical protein [Burkholderia sp. Bp8986]|uniref:hypothetical protein n=1 Tax=Burkholderia sp. Bp8986 TaxID=2184550 RepID=UPI000F5ADC86|nr:hypothetical protein [Burkholderia sp. Bp8986]RQS42811.1 hypothetical protein DID99_35550 [Burkholderia sp. Bp8986]
MSSKINNGARPNVGHSASGLSGTQEAAKAAGRAEAVGGQSKGVNSSAPPRALNHMLEKMSVLAQAGMEMLDARKAARVNAIPIPGGSAPTGSAPGDPVSQPTGMGVAYFGVGGNSMSVAEAAYSQGQVSANVLASGVALMSVCAALEQSNLQDIYNQISGNNAISEQATRFADELQQSATNAGKSGGYPFGGDSPDQAEWEAFIQWGLQNNIQVDGQSFQDWLTNNCGVSVSSPSEWQQIADGSFPVPEPSQLSASTLQDVASSIKQTAQAGGDANQQLMVLLQQSNANYTNDMQAVSSLIQKWTGLVASLAQAIGR